jgi:non-specific serine/threonine protein kinase/serine/threonine-protein kinase
MDATLVDGTASETFGDAPERIGAYLLIELLGRGGMGEVFRARQTSPVDREVAVKLLVDKVDPALLALFEVERRILARMHHPSIAQFFDAGTAPDGRPYFVMELVSGVPLDAYCRDRSLPFAERARLLMQICAAVQHAHNRGVVHRDLKPSNVLIADVDGMPLPKLIDFGIASASSVRARRAGTRGYMSPDQLRDDESVDTRDDVYALGVIACELLADLSTDAVSSAVSQLPARPSAANADVARGSTSALRHSLADAAHGDASVSMHSATALRGDLGSLLVRAVHPERHLRYPSPAALADDLQRLLNNEPVLAHRGGALYVARKFVRRHRLMVASALTLLAALLVALSVSLWALDRARDERDAANRAQAEADRQARIAASVNRFLVDDLLGAANLDENSRADRTTLLEVVERAASRLDTEQNLEPEAAADIHFAFGRALASLGRYEQAERAFAQSANLRAERLGNNSLPVLSARAAAAATLIERSRHDDARRLLGQLLAAVEGEPPFAGLEDQLRIDMSRNETFAGHYEIADQLLAPVIADPASQGHLSQARRLLGWIRSRQGRHAEAEELMRAIVSESEASFGADSWPTLMAEGALSTTLHRADKFAEALALRLRVVAAIRQRFPNHAEFGVQLSHLAAHQMALGNAVEAETAAREAIDQLKLHFPAEHRMNGNAHSHLGAALTVQGRWSEALAALEEARRIFAAALPPTHALIVQNDERLRAWREAQARPTP